jgi:TrmH family RNA methyltransferase
MRRVSSRQNDAVRAFRALAKEPDPAGERLLLDGAHLIRDARDAGVGLELAAIASSRLDVDSEEARLARALERNGIDVLVASDQVFSVISPVRSPSGLVAIAVRRSVAVSEICDRRDGLVLTAIDVQDPGNLGSLVRGAEAGGVTGMIVCASSRSHAASPFSWKALRGSMGSALRLPLAAGIDAEAALDCLRRAGARTVAAVPAGGRDPDSIDWSGHVGLVVGGEGAGLPEAIVARCDERVSVPMTPPVESLNVAVAGAILVYAARRQRQ